MIKKLCIIIVNYNCAKDINNVIGLIKNQNNIEHDIYVVDNASKDVGLIDSRFCTLIKNDSNLGFAGGVNTILNDEAMQNNYETFLLINPDIIQFSDTFREKITGGDSKYDIYGCPVLYTDGKTIQSAGGKIRNINGHTILLNKGQLYKDYSKNDKSVDFVSGCCMAISKNVLKTINGLPEEYFLYFEESDFCRIAHNKGFKIGVLSDIYVVHDTSSTIGYLSNTYLYYMIRNQKIFSYKILKWYFMPLFWVWYILYFVTGYIVLSIINKTPNKILYIIKGLFSYDFK